MQKKTGLQKKETHKTTQIIVDNKSKICIITWIIQEPSARVKK